MDENLLRYNKETVYAFLDLETMNLCLNFQQNRPVQVAVLEVKHETVIGSLDLRINWPDAPHLKVGAGAAAVTKFNQADHDRVAIHEDHVYAQMWPILKRADRIIMHNGLNFDLYLLKEWARMKGDDWEWILHKTLDTNSLARGLKLNIKYDPEKDNLIEYQYRMAQMVVKGCKTNLAQLCRDYQFPIDETKTHEALYDLEMTKGVWDKMKWQLAI